MTSEGPFSICIGRASFPGQVIADVRRKNELCRHAVRKIHASRFNRATKLSWVADRRLPRPLWRRHRHDGSMVLPDHIFSRILSRFRSSHLHVSSTLRIAEAPVGFLWSRPSSDIFLLHFSRRTSLSAGRIEMRTDSSSEPLRVVTSDAFPLRGHQACRRSGAADEGRSMRK